MAREYRGLLTDREREIKRGDAADVDQDYEYRVNSRIRSKLEELEDDIELLREHDPALYDELVDAVCPDEPTTSNPP